MKCGTSQVCITPPVGIELSGYAARVQPSVGVCADLYVRGLFLEEGSEKLLWLHADLVGFDREWTATLRRELAAELGLEARQILFSATHTHAGPATVTALPPRRPATMQQGAGCSAHNACFDSAAPMKPTGQPTMAAGRGHAGSCSILSR